MWLGIGSSCPCTSALPASWARVRARVRVKVRVRVSEGHAHVASGAARRVLHGSPIGVRTDG